MEEIPSSSESDADSDQLSKEVEEELYSVLHHNDFSNGVPPELLAKYSISTGKGNEFVIALKSSANESNPTSDVVDCSQPMSELREFDAPKKSASGGVVAVDPNSTLSERVGNNNNKNTMPISNSRKRGSEVIDESKSSSIKSRKKDDYVDVEFDSTPNARQNDTEWIPNPRKRSSEVVVELHTDSDSDGSSSCVVVEDPPRDRTISLSSSESIVVLSEPDEDTFDFSLNTTGDISYDSDGNVSDVVGNSSFQWEKVASPSTWTREMRKYYNSSCERLRYFDHKTIRQQLKAASRKEWKISPRDLFPNKRPQQRCLICRQTDHMARNCPKQDPTCHMCGVQGHSNMDCPNSICLQCGKGSRQFTSICRSCSHTLSRECFNCKQTGHESRACPEKWRAFHSTTEGPLKKERECPVYSRPLQCCNCGQSNHTFEECNQQYMSNFTKSLPAYNWLFGRSGLNEDWRYGGPSQFTPRRNFEPPYKRQKNHHGESFRDELRNSLPKWFQKPAPKTRNKKKKKRKEFRNSF